MQEILSRIHPTIYALVVLTIISVVSMRVALVYSKKRLQSKYKELSKKEAQVSVERSKKQEDRIRNLNKEQNRS